VAGSTDDSRGDLIWIRQRQNVRGYHASMFKHILLPTDGSALSNEAVRAGVALAKALGARVTGFFAAPPPTPVVYSHFLPVGLTSPEAHAQLIERAANEHLAVVKRAADAAGVPCDLLHQTNDFPADAIIETARTQHCDCIFMSSHGRHGRRGTMLGSETQKVAATAHVPVIVYRVETAS
jgi:nucleotide-binding universal stress UspA family protein